MSGGRQGRCVRAGRAGGADRGVAVDCGVVDVGGPVEAEVRAGSSEPVVVRRDGERARNPVERWPAGGIICPKTRLCTSGRSSKQKISGRKANRSDE